MGHNLMEEGNRSMYVGVEGTPWHGLGQSLPEAVSAEDAVRTIKADFPVETVPVYAKDGDRFIELPTSRATVGRIHGYPGGPGANPGMDPVYGVVSDRYRVIQNMDAAEAYRGITGLRIHTGGLLGEGETLWLMGEVDPARALFLAGDETKKYVVLANRHDGTGAARMFFTPVRVVCQNTLSAALSGASVADGIKIRHRGNIKDKIAEASETLGFAVKFFQRMERDANRLAAFRPTSPQRTAFLDAVAPLDPPDPHPRSYAQQSRNRIIDLSIRGKGNARHDGSAWALYNGLTDWADHERRGTGPDARPDARFATMVWGSGARLKARGFDTLAAMAPALPKVI